MSACDRYSPALTGLLDYIERKVVDGVKHGHFKIEVTGMIGNKKQREVVVDAGMMEKFFIPEDELPR